MKPKTPSAHSWTWRRIDPSIKTDRKEVIDWWLDHTGTGGEGVVFKPNAVVVKGEKGPVQPASKVRGRDCLRIIYGPDYVLSENIDRLRKRGLMRKFSLADREFLLGLEGLQRSVERKTTRIRQLICVVDPSRCPPSAASTVPESTSVGPTVWVTRSAKVQVTRWQKLPGNPVYLLKPTGRG